MSKYAKVNYDGMDNEAASEQAKAARRGQYKREVIFYPLKQGDHWFRILPPGFGDKVFIPSASGSFALPVYEHWNIPRSDDNKERFRCPKQTYPDAGVDCPICASLNKFWDWTRDRGLEYEQAREILGKSYRLSRRAYMNVVARNVDDTQEVEYEGKLVVIPKVWILGVPMTAVYQQVRNLFIERNEEGKRLYGDDPLNPEDGYDIKIAVRGEGLDTRYTCSVQSKKALVSKSDDPVQERFLTEAICANANDLGKYFRLPKESELERARVLGDRVLGLMSQSVPKASPAASNVRSIGSTEARSTFSKPAESTATPNGAPTCYGNHLLSLPKCMECPFEDDCTESTAVSGAAVELRRAVHGLGTAQA